MHGSLITYATGFAYLFDSGTIRNITRTLILRAAIFKVPRRVPAPDDPEELLRQRTRARLFEALLELKRPATTEELAALMSLHRTGVRVHLDRLQAAGLLQRQRVRKARGRPQDAWSIRPDARPRPASRYGDLAAWLAAAIPPEPRRLREVEDAGRSFGRDLAGDGPDLPLERRLEATLAALGFQPRLVSDAEGELCFVLGNCPYRDAVHANQAVVCTLHRGLTEGMLERLHPGAALRAFLPRDPDEGGCLVEVDT
jgi:predicted ArsR family transcriptional regulator